MRIALPALIIGLLLSSALVPRAMAQNRGGLVVYREANFQGEQRRLDREVRDFGDINLNDRVSSVRVESGSWELCEDANFRGRCITVSRDVRDLAGSGIDDRISSARPIADRNARTDSRPPDRGADVTLFADVGFGGDSREVSGEVGDFRSIRFNDTVSSIRIRSGSWQFCEDADFRGRCITAERDMPSLVPSGFNDKISSMRRLR